MRIAVISDIHANLSALTRTFEVIDQLSVDRVYCLGDIVGYGPSPNECIALIRERCAAVVKGNHDCGAIGEVPLDHFNTYGRSAIRWTKKHLTRKNTDYLRNLPLLQVEDDITFVHASPLHPADWRYIFAWPDAQRSFSAFGTRICFIGHTHIPVVVGEDGSVNIFRDGKRYLINVGSVGQARDGNPKASFGMLDTTAKTFEALRVEYDIEATAKAILAANLPDYLAQRLFLGI
jgi:diadenosine tetraphosphatase ApaH/serine/threonine PP2A family protein phosphatase